MRIDIDRGLLASILRDGISGFYDYKLTEEMLQGSSVVAFRFIESFWKEHQKIPDPKTVIDKTGVDLFGVPAEPISFWAGEIEKRYLFRGLQEKLTPVMDLLEKKEPKAALEQLESTLVELRKSVPSSSRPTGIFADVEGLWADYEKAQLGLTGVATPFPTISNSTKGWQQEELIVVAARQGQGKSWVLLLCARAAWLSGKRVLIASTEMSNLGMMRRAVALATKTSYGRLKYGKLKPTEEDFVKEELERLKHDQNFLIMGGGFDVTLESIETAIIDSKPDIVCIDSFYLLKSSSAKGHNRFERIGQIIEQIKEIARRNKVAIIVTTQLNRPPKDTKPHEAGLERLAFSDNIGNIADYVFYLDQDAVQKQAREMTFRPIKTRDSEFIGDIIINWDFDNLNFSEKGKEEESPAPQSKDGPRTFYTPSIEDEDYLDDVPY